MSSHHIVRDEQEPALLIVNPESLPLELVHNLLEWSPTVIVTEQALATVKDWEIKVDVVVCAEANVRELTKALMAQAPVRFLAHPPEEAPLLNTFYFLTSNHYPAVNILADLETQDAVFFESLHRVREHMDVVIYSQGRKCHIVSSQFEKWLPKGEKIQIAPVDNDCLLTTQGFYPDLKQEELEEGHTLVVKEDGKIRLESNGKAFWVCENLS